MTATPSTQRGLVEPLRVLHIGLEAASSRPGGLNRYLEALIGAERSVGIDATGVVLGDEPDVDAYPNGVEVVGSRHDPLRRRLTSMLAAAGRRPLPQVVDAHFALYAALPVRTSLRKVPLVVHFQGPWAAESSTEGGSRLSGRLKRLIERSVYRRADALVVLSDAFGAIASTTYGVASWRIHQLAPGVDLETFAPGDQAEARRIVGVAPTARVVVAVRRLRNRMGLEFAIEAIALHGRISDIELVIVGDGPERERLEALANRLDARVRFAGRVSDADLVAWYRAADVSVVPTVALEGFGLVVLESLAAGTPVIASDLDGLRDAVSEFPGAVLVPPGDAAQLRERLDAFFEADVRRPTALECRRFAEEHGWLEVARRHEALYRTLVDDPGSPRRPKVVVVGHTASLSGGELALARMVPALLRSVDLHVILAEDGPLRERLEAAGATVEVLVLPERARSIRKESVTGAGVSPGVVRDAARYVLALRSRLRTLRPDIVHTNTLKAALYGGMAARLARVPVVVWHVRDRISDDYLPSGAVRLVRGASRFLADGIIANSQVTLDAVGRGRTPACVVPSPLEPSITARPMRDEGPVVIGVLGRLAPWKGQMLFLDAFATAFGGGDERAVIIGASLFGEEAFAESLAQRARELGIAERVEFRGFRVDVAAELARLDVLVHCSLTPEPFGQVVVEGMAAGLPVLAAAAGGPAEIIDDGVDGILYPMGDEHALSEALRSIADDPAARRTIGERASMSAQRYGAAAVASSVLAFYDQLAGHAR